MTRATALLLLLAGCATERPPPPPVELKFSEPAPPIWDLSWGDCERGDKSSCELLLGSLSDEEPSLKPKAAQRGCELGCGRCCLQQARDLSTTDAAAACEVRWSACEKLHELDACSDLVWPLVPATGQKAGPHQLEAAKELCGHGPMPSHDCEAVLFLLERAPAAELDPFVARAICSTGRPEECDAQVARAWLGWSTGDLFGPHASVRREPKHALELFDRACNAGNADACDTEASLYFSGDEGRGQRGRAVEIAAGSCQSGHPQSCFMLARLQLAPGKQHDLTAAVSGFEKSCSAAGCWRAAGGYLASRGQLAKAQPFFDRACQANDVDGCEEVGRTRVLRGERGKAVEALLEGPCESGSRVACRAVASISSGARAKHFYELGKEREGAISDDIRQSYSRTVDGKGSTGDSILMAATILTGGFPALFAILPSRPVTGFGFLERDYPDP